MNKLDINSAYQALQASSRDNSYGKLGNMPVSDGWTFGAGLATGRNFRNQILQEQEAERNRKRFEDNYRQLNMKHQNGSGGVSPQQNVTQMNQMPTLDGGMYNGRSTPNNGVYMQGRQDMNFPKINDVTKMGNLYGDERSTPNNGVYMQGRKDMSFPKVDNVTNMGNLYGNGTNKYTFNDADYVPSKENGYHINDNPRMAEWGTPQDWQRQQVRNAMRDVYEGTDWYKLPYNGFGSAIARAEQPVDHYPQELVGLTGEDLQRAGLAYNQNIDNKYNGFRQVIQNAERPQYQSSVYDYSKQSPQVYNQPDANVIVPDPTPDVSSLRIHGNTWQGGGGSAFGPAQEYVDPAPNLPVENNPYRQYGLDGESDVNTGGIMPIIDYFVNKNRSRYDDSF